MNEYFNVYLKCDTITDYFITGRLELLVMDTTK